MSKWVKTVTYVIETLWSDGWGDASLPPSETLEQGLEALRAARKTWNGMKFRLMEVKTKTRTEEMICFGPPKTNKGETV